MPLLLNCDVPSFMFNALKIFKFLVFISIYGLMISQAEAISLKEFLLIKSYSAEQKSLIIAAFKNPDFLIGDQLKDLDAKNFIITGVDGLQLNIYLSGINRKTFSYTNDEPSIEVINGNPLSTKRKLLDFANSHKIKAIDLSYQGLYSSATAYYKNALSAFLILKDTHNVASASSNLAHLYFLKRDFKHAAEHNKLALKYYNLLHNEHQHLNALIFKAHLALLSGDYKTAENLILKKALIISVNKRNEQKCYLELGKIYLKSKKYTEAKWFFIQSYTVAEKLNSKILQIQSLLLLARVKNIIKDHSLAKQDLLIVKKLIDKSYERYKQDLELELINSFSSFQN